MAKKKTERLSHFHMGIFLVIGVILCVLISQMMNQQAINTESQAAGVARGCNESCDRGSFCQKGLACVSVGDERLCRDPRSPNNQLCNPCPPGMYMNAEKVCTGL